MKKVLLFLIPAMLFAAGCSKDDNNSGKVRPGSVNLTRKGTQQISTSLPGDVFYSSQDNYIASVSTDGLITAHHIGTTTITVSNERSEGTVRVTVVPTVTTFTEPSTNWGAKKTDIIQQYGSPDEGQDDIFIYRIEGRGKVTHTVVYTFVDNALRSSEVRIDQQYKKSMEEFLLERYELVDYTMDGERMVYCNGQDPARATTMVESWSFSSSQFYVKYYDPLHAEAL